MKIAQQFVLLTALLMPFAGASAAVYKSVDEKGNVVYTDEPGAEAKPLDLPPISTVPAPRYRATPQAGAAAAPPTAAYEQLSIVSPARDATLRDNTGAVLVTVTTVPELLAGHRFVYYLDGEPQGEPVQSPQTSIANVDRGAHDLEVAVVDGSGKELIRSDSVRFYLHRQSLNFPARQGQPTPR